MVVTTTTNGSNIDGLEQAERRCEACLEAMEQALRALAR